MSSKKPPIKTPSVFATDEWQGKAAYRSLPSRSHEAVRGRVSQITHQRTFRVSHALLLLVESLLLLGLAFVLLHVLLPS